MSLLKKLSEKDLSIYNKAYEKLYYKTKEELVDDFIKRFNRLKESYDKVETTKRLGPTPEIGFLKMIGPQSIYDILCLGIHESLITENFSYLHNALYTYNHLKYVQDYENKSGYDHCIFFKNVVNSFAALDINLIRKYFPKEIGLSKKGHTMLVTASNLIIGLLHNDVKWKKHALEQAEIFLEKKNTQYENIIVEYLIAVCKQDIYTINKKLQEAVDLYRKMDFIHDFFSDISKFCAIFCYGLYFIAYYFLPKEEFNKIQQPKHTSWWIEYINYCTLINFTKGENYINFPSEISFLNNYME